jgi:uncharacterized protein (UPF0248 family)
MQPIHELFNRIRWDREYGAADFELDYLDRLKNNLIRVAFSELVFDPDDHFRFSLIDQEGEVHAIPYHRVKAVYRNGERIWHREH